MSHESASEPYASSPPRERASGGCRLRVCVGGAVQGVGFRPFVYRLAGEMGLQGWVRNDSQGVELEVEGVRARLETFHARLQLEAPEGSRIESCEAVWLDAAGHEGFFIRGSEAPARASAWIRPDSATCPACLAEVRDPGDRRYRYPFTNCTHCGPRYSILERLPYDRPNTSMRGFAMCPACEAEYRDPADRRFHAQPNACPACGPRLGLWDACGQVLAEEHDALRRAAAAVRAGSIVALKGLGGFQLIVRADDAEAVRRLRARKQREEKPFALMFPTVETVRRCCRCAPAEARLLQSAEAPIVLLDRGSAFADSEVPAVAANVAPGQSTLGVMLPYTPLHHLLLDELKLAVVATSGNRTDEPICTDEQEALHRLRGIADLFLVHDRPIVRHVDDSIVRRVAGRELMLRRARGYAPLPIRVGRRAGCSDETILGVGAHWKNSVALGWGEHVFISQHIGDLETVEAHDAFRRVISDLERLYEVEPTLIAADAHPDYLATRYACERGVPVERVQHHLAHVAAVMAESEIEGPVLGVAWDGTGLGEDRTIWGGEFLRVDGMDWERVAHVRPFPLPGGDLAAREPRRSAFGLLSEWQGDPGAGCETLPTFQAFSAGEIELLSGVIRSGINAPRTSSMGRLFDAVASLTGLRQRCGFEGQAAMELEAAADRALGQAEAYPLRLEAGAGNGASAILDWSPLLDALLADGRHGVAPELVAARFHAALVEAAVAVARHAGEPAVVLAGGCFQNRRLLEGCIRRLGEEGFRVYWPQRVPPNDGGLALGQWNVARWRRDAERTLFRKTT